MTLIYNRKKMREEEEMEINIPHIINTINNLI